MGGDIFCVRTKLKRAFAPVKSGKAGKPRAYSTGFTLVEILVDVSIVALVAAGVLSAYSAGFRAMELAKAKTAAVALANEKTEELRNMPYDSLATEHGPIIPQGNILDNEEIVRQGVRFNVKVDIRYVDDDYDGNISGTVVGKPQDFYPYDYKKIEVTVSKIGRNGYLARLTSNVAAKAAETPTNSGIIYLCVVDSAEQPVSEADVTITNTVVNPSINIISKTGSDGCIMIPNLPEDLHNHYHLTATKEGFSIDQTYQRTAQNPHALFPDVNVLIQQVTNQTLRIDRLSSMNITVTDVLGQPVVNTTVHVEGTKKIYFNPDTYKYSQDHTTDAEGRISLTNLEFDDYKITLNGWHIVSTSPYQPVGLRAGVTSPVYLTVANSASYLTLSSVEPLAGKAGETVRLTMEGKNFDAAPIVKLLHSTGGEIIGQNIVVTANETLEADFNLTGALIGQWDILIINPNGDTIRQVNGFEVTN